MKKIKLEDLQADLKKVVEMVRLQSHNHSSLELRVQMNEMQITGIKRKMETPTDVSVVNKDLTI